MKLVTAVETLARLRDESRRAGLRVGFVPTMGALHEGHGSLVKRARAECERVVASIFVNPLQFGPGEDFERYPRDLEGDRAKLEAWGCDVLFTTSPSALYRQGFQTYVVPDGPIVERYEGALRPGHFRGVATVVAKLLNLTGPTHAYFGRKDAQQAAVIRRMVDDLNVPVRVVVCPTARDSDGLALSSRNVYLSTEERAAAAGLPRALEASRARFREGERSAPALRAALENELRRIPDAALDYADLVDPDTFVPYAGELRDGARAAPPVLAVAAVRFRSTRLLDNLRLDEEGP